MRKLLLLSIFTIVIIGCEKQNDKTSAFRAGKVDANSTIYIDLLPDKEIYFEPNIQDTIKHYDTLDIDYDLDGINDFSIEIEQHNTGSVMYISGYLRNINDISFSNYPYANGLLEGDTINESLTWMNSNVLIMFIWSSGNVSSWSKLYYFAFKFTIANEIKYGWIGAKCEAYADEDPNNISSFRYTIYDLAYQK